MKNTKWIKYITHNNTKFMVERFYLSHISNDPNPIRYQAFYGDYALSEMTENESIAIMQAIKTINENYHDHF